MGSPAVPAPQEMKILAVDDIKANLLALERTLVGVPARVIKAGGAEEALAATLEHRFALAILDVQMPGVDGYELAEILLADRATSRLPIIFVTAAHADEAHRFRGYEAGAVDYIVKPYDPEVLRSKVRVFLELASYRFDLERLVTERTQELRQREHQHRTLFDTMTQGVVYQAADGTITEANPAAARILGVPASQLVGLQLSDPRWAAAGPDGASLPAHENPLSRSVHGGQAVRDALVRVHHPWTRSPVDLRVDATPEFRGGEPTPHRVYTIFTDVTESLRAQAALQASLTEKETLLKEIHHRVKNNLQVISSLLMLQVDAMPAAGAMLLRESLQRVRSMALVHEQLYGAASLDRIDLGGYARELAESLRMSFSPSARIRVDADPVEVRVDAAVPLGLVLNELVTNSLKYGLNPARAGSEWDVRVEVQVGEGTVRLAVSDEGPGYPAQLDLDKSASLGLQIVRLLAHQLRGSVVFRNAGGARCEVACPYPLR